MDHSCKRYRAPASAGAALSAEHTNRSWHVVDTWGLGSRGGGSVLMLDSLSELMKGCPKALTRYPAGCGFRVSGFGSRCMGLKQKRVSRCVLVYRSEAYIQGSKWYVS